MNKLLLLDVGNTRVKWAVASIPDEKALRLAGEKPTEELTLSRIRELAKKYPRHTVVLSSVVPKLISSFQQAFEGRFHSVTSNIPTLGLRFDYPKPSELGADRIAAAVAINAEKLYPAIIVAAGTATAFTVLDAQGRFAGGAIAPGLQTQLAALIGATAQLPSPDLRLPRNVLAKSTKDAIRTGVLLGYQGGVREIISQLSEAIPGPAKPHLTLTGGNAKHLAMNLELPFKLRPLLVLEGLRIIGRRILYAGENEPDER